MTVEERSGIVAFLSRSETSGRVIANVARMNTPVEAANQLLTHTREAEYANF